MAPTPRPAVSVATSSIPLPGPSSARTPLGEASTEAKTRLNSESVQVTGTAASVNDWPSNSSYVKLTLG